MSSPIKPLKNESKIALKSPIKPSQLNNSRVNNEKNGSSSPPPKFGIRPNNSKVMFLKHEIDSKETWEEKLKQAHLKEILE